METLCMNNGLDSTTTTRLTSSDRHGEWNGKYGDARNMLIN